MGRKEDLEQAIQESYQLIREFEEKLRLSDDPREKVRVRRDIEEQWELIHGYLEEYLGEYLPLCRRIGTSPPADIAEIAARFEAATEKRVLAGGKGLAVETPATAHPEYETFELLVGRKIADGYPVTITHAPAGDANGLCQLDPTADDLRAALDRIESGYTTERFLVSFGRRLFDGLFAAEITTLFRASLGQARGQGKGLRVRLRIEPPELATLPWEYLYDAGEDCFLAISPEMPLVRYVPMPHPSRPITVSPPLRVLVVISHPRDTLPLDVEQEKSIIEQALRDWVHQGLVQLRFIERAVVAEISQAMRSFRPHVFHFIGHGQFRDDEAGVVLEDDDGYARWVGARAFREVFLGIPDTRLAVLNACQTAIIPSAKSLAGLAPRILQRHLAAVVAMQYPISDDAALIFSREFYRSLALGYPVDMAISEARKGIFLEMGGDVRDWGTPVLFLRAQDGRLFEVAKVEETKAESSAGPKYEIHFEGRTEGVVIGDHNVVYQTILQRYPSLKDYAYDVTDTINRVTEWFVGREFVFQWLEETFRKHSCGYLRLIADAGLGKTAIAAEVAKRYKAPVHFVDASMGITRPDQCLNHLCARLIARYGLEHDHLPARAGEDSDFFRQLLGEAVERADGRPVLVVIDGLDEAEPVPPGANWLLLPGSLPRGAYILLTHRPGDYLLAADAATPVKEMEIPWKHPRQQADIEAHLRRQAERPEIRRALEGATPPIPVERFVAALKEASEGNFKYLDYVLADIGGREPGFDPLDLERLPRGLRGYYETFWARMAPPPDAPEEEWERWEQRDLPILAGLGAAGEPVTVEWLADHTGQETWRVRRLLTRWQRFLRRERRDGAETWRIVHRSFADFLAEKVDLSAAHRRAAAHYLADPARWQAHGGYAFRHLSAHLAAAEEYEELGRLIERREWYAAQRDYDPARLAYARDVERALEMAEGRGVEGVPAVVGWSLLYGTVRTLASNVPVGALEAMAQLGEKERALRYAELITEPGKQAEAYWRIALAMWEQAGKRRDRLVGEALARALQAAEGIESDRYRAKALSAIAQAFAQVGDREGLARALQAAEGIESDWRRAEALSAIAQAFARVGDFDRAFQAVEGVESDWYYAEALSAIAQAFAQVGDREGLARALQAAERIGDGLHRAWALSAVAQAFAQVGETEQARQALARALQAAEWISDDWQRAWALSALAQAFAQVGETEQARQALTRALQAAEGIRAADDRAEALSAVAEALAQVGETEQACQALTRALQAAEGIRYTGDRARALSAIAQAFTQVGDRGWLARTLQATERIKSDWVRAEALSDLAQAFARAGETEQAHQALTRALQTAERIGDGLPRAGALFALAQALAQVGETEQVRQALTRALQAAEGIRAADDRAEALSAIAQAFAQVGDREGLARALQAAERIGDAENRAWALSAIAQAFAQVGETEEARQALARALQAAEGIGDADLRARALSTVAEAFAQVDAPAEEAAGWLVAAFRAARARGRGEVWYHIGVFAPLLGKLGLLPAAWERIQAVEAVVGG
ncbi:MAG: CHAT domain-containing protein [Anaerolineae bacterium]|nr:CHAT domain-containing protein [Anaerolineae bacterium]